MQNPDLHREVSKYSCDLQRGHCSYLSLVTAVSDVAGAVTPRVPALEHFPSTGLKWLLEGDIFLWP